MKNWWMRLWKQFGNEITEGFKTVEKVRLAVAVLLILVLSVILAVCYKKHVRTKTVYVLCRLIKIMILGTIGAFTFYLAIWPEAFFQDTWANITVIAMSSVLSLLVILFMAVSVLHEDI